MARPLLQVAAVLLLTLVLLEAALQLAASLSPRFLSRTSTSASRGAIRILCVGDSHTYGAGVAILESYPRRLRAILAQRYPELDFEVHNLGIPGLNSAYVANRLERQIAQLRPDLVIVWVGINNSWNSKETETWEAGGPWSGLRRLLHHSRLFRLAVVVWATRPGATPLEPTREELATTRGHHPTREESPAMTRGRRPAEARSHARFENREAPLMGAELRRGLELDLSRMAEAAAAHATPLVFVNYPYAFLPELRAAIQSAGARLRIPVVDTAEDAGRAQADGVHPIFVWGAGHHPSRALYGYIAESVATAAGRALALPDPPPES